MTTTWWQSFFDDDYIRLWGARDERTPAEVEGIWGLLGLGADSRLLDAPCGYGRLSRPLAERGERVSYRQHDLRTPLDEGGFDAAMNVFTSLGYGGQEDDLAVIRTLAAAVRPGGLVLIETMHRDLFIARRTRGTTPSHRQPDGTLFLEETRFDPVSGRCDTSWYWAGPAGSGAKSSSMRVYSITELVHMLEAGGLRLRAVHRGCSLEPFVSDGPDAGGRVALLAERP